ncbi:anthranilate synthase component II [Planctomicrobium sp. SH527]|uniref:anthranilate synthase component II n=1 Tax=Planctomicrobium sp. SH527 TaxID=3448123 RepID=UPI003F5C5D0A
MPATVLLIDNYDSFVFNLARYLQELGVSTEVRRNDAISVAEILDNPPQAIVLSPGPCAPDQAGICLDLIAAVSGRIPLLGVCLGHQAIGQAFGGKVVRAPEPMHGRASSIAHSQQGIFEGCESPLQVARYHSLVIERESLPKSLNITAATADGVIMGLEHSDWPVYGVQFHPESILTESGHLLLRNFLTLAGIEHSKPASSEIILPVHSRHSEEDDFYQRPIDEDATRPN